MAVLTRIALRRPASFQSSSTMSLSGATDSDGGEGDMKLQ